MRRMFVRLPGAPAGAERALQRLALFFGAFGQGRFGPVLRS